MRAIMRCRAFLQARGATIAKGAPRRRRATPNRLFEGRADAKSPGDRSPGLLYWTFWIRSAEADPAAAGGDRDPGEHREQGDQLGDRRGRLRLAGRDLEAVE